MRAQDLVMPMFVMDGEDTPPEEVGSMPGIVRRTIADTVKEVQELWELGVRGVALFPKIDPSLKDERGSEALNRDNLVNRAVRALKREVPDVVLFTDVALDPYTTHGHDGVLNEAGDAVANDATVEILCQMAVMQAEAGVDFVSPSDMMDGRIGAIRRALDKAGFTDTGVMAYSAKFASSFYGPFRDAVGSASAAGTRHLDKRTYQLNPANRREAMIETRLDEEEGADMLMVKPAGPYLDIIRELRDRTSLPVTAYQVSGEFAQLHAAARMGWLDLDKTMMESVLCIRRAGADLIFTYFAKDIAQKLRS